jgi:sec-independent protein translocase protein TatB
MTFLGIGPGELFVLLIILLVVVGPERLPVFARQLGKGIVSLRNWVQRSPDAQLFLSVRDELENELRSIRDDLNQEMESVRLEMQHVREEMIQATREATVDVSRQLDDASLASNTALQATSQPAPDATTASLPTTPPITPITPPAGAELAPASDDLSEFSSAIAEMGSPTGTPPVGIIAPSTSEALPPTDVTPIPSIAPPQLQQAHTTALNADTAATNGVPLPVPRTAKPNAPKAAEDIEPNAIEILELREQFLSMSAELQALREQIRQIQQNLPAIGEAPTTGNQPLEATT